MRQRNLVVCAATVAGAIALATGAVAAPLSPAPLTLDGATVERVAGGCGPGWHPNRWNECRPNFGPRPYWGGPGYRAYGGYYGPPPRPVYRPYGFYGPRPFF